MTVEVVVLSASPSGLASMLAGLLDANLARHPERAALLRPAVVQLDAWDAGVTVTLRLRPGRVEIADGSPTSRPDVAIRASSQDLLSLSTAPLRFGFPDPLRAEGRASIGRIARRAVRVSGMVRRPMVLSRFARLLSVA